jgi:aminoglycoside 2'-N-acetyltransferase I
MRSGLRIAQTEELEEAEAAAISALCAAAFDEPWEDAWDKVGPGLHVYTSGAGGIFAHALIVDRRLYLGHEPDLALDVGYVEWVATRPDRQGQGHGTAVMREIGRIIGDEYVLGALATGSNAFYERLGWETWRGPTSVRMPDGQRVRSPEEDGDVMILRTARTPGPLDLGGPIAVDWRAKEPW